MALPGTQKNDVSVSYFKEHKTKFKVVYITEIVDFSDETDILQNKNLKKCLFSENIQSVLILKRSFESKKLIKITKEKKEILIY